MLCSLRTFLSIAISFVVFAVPLVADGQSTSSPVSNTGIAQVDITASLKDNGRLQVTEKLRYDFGAQKQTGFVRKLTAPTGGTVNIQSVRRDGLSENYRTVQAGRVKRVIFGTEGIQLTGQHNYSISYVIDDPLISTGEAFRFQWPVVTDSNVEAENITINLRLPSDVSAVTCSIGVTAYGCPVDKTQAGVRATADTLPAQSNLVIRADVPAEAVAVNPGPAEDTDSNWLSWIIVVLIAVFAGSGIGWYLHDEDTNQEPTPEHVDTLTG